MYLKIKVVPRAKKQEIVKIGKDCLRVKLISLPIKDRANRELVELLAGYFGVKKSAVKIIKGVHSRKKLIELGDPG